MTYDPSITFRPDPKPKKRAKKSTAIPDEIVAAVFVRDNFTCLSCRVPQSPEQHSLQVHHLIKRSQGGKNVMENLATVCWECHAMIERGEIDIWGEYEIAKKVIEPGSKTWEEYEKKMSRYRERLGV